MEQKEVAKLISENMKNIFTFSLSRLADRCDAEDLANDIVCEILKSAHRLRDDKTFYGFIWSIAKNTYMKYIRNKKQQQVEFDEEIIGVYWNTPETEYANSEELYLLKRELSLLSSQYREATVAYYFKGKSCSVISQELNISIEMVKYYLFKSRKILKEGIGMTREFGEKSFNPGTFRMDFWGNGDCSAFWNLFKRKLPGNILLSAYYNPISIIIGICDRKHA